MRMLCILALCVYGLFAPASVQAMQCMPLAMAEQTLEQMGRQQIGQGVAGNAGLVGLYVDQEGGWSLVLIRPQGMACIIGNGDDWETLVPKKGQPS